MVINSVQKGPWIVRDGGRVVLVIVRDGGRMVLVIVRDGGRMVLGGDIEHLVFSLTYQHFIKIDESCDRPLSICIPKLFTFGGYQISYHPLACGTSQHTRYVPRHDKIL